MLNNFFVKRRSMTKSMDLKSDFLRGCISRQFNNIGIHFSLISWRTDSSDAILPILPKMESAARWNARLAWSEEYIIYHFASAFGAVSSRQLIARSPAVFAVIELF